MLGRDRPVTTWSAGRPSVVRLVHLCPADVWVRCRANFLQKLHGSYRISSRFGHKLVFPFYHQILPPLRLPQWQAVWSERDNSVRLLANMYYLAWVLPQFRSESGWGNGKRNGRVLIGNQESCKRAGNRPRGWCQNWDFRGSTCLQVKQNAGSSREKSQKVEKREIWGRSRGRTRDDWLEK